MPPHRLRRAEAIGALTALLLMGQLGGALAAEPPQFRHSVPAPQPQPERPQFRGAPVPRAEAASTPEPILESPGGYSSSGGRPAASGLEGVTTIPAGGYQTEPVGIRYSSLFRNTQFPYGNPVTIPSVEPTVRPGNIHASVRLDAPAIAGGLPVLDRGFEPEDADLKIGPVYFKLNSLQGAVLHSDNIDLEPDDKRESGTIAIISLNLSIVAQLTEGLRLATSGSIAYLPIQNEAGVAGLGLPYLWALGYYTGPSTRAQIAWDTVIGGWNVVFADEFQIGLGIYSDDVRSDYSLFEGFDFNKESRAGRYVFSPYGGSQYPRRRDDDNRNRFDDNIVVYSNTISASTERLLPGPVRLRARIYREDLWYNQGNRGLPQLREGGFIGLNCERENMRFKPYVTYEAFHTDTQDSFTHIFRLGVNGPITDQLYFHGEIGYYVDGDGNSGNLWTLQLHHYAGPYTEHTFTYTRAFSEFHDEIIEGFGYNLHQILGPKLRGDLFVSRLQYENYDGADQFSRTETNAGLRLAWTLGPKTTLQGSVIYTWTDPTNTETWTGRLDLDYNFTDTLLGRFSYQRLESTSSISDLNYSENLFFMSLTKYFQ